MDPLATGNTALSRGNTRIWLRTEVLDALMEAKGAKSHAEHARRFGIDRSNYYLIRTGRKTPLLETALRIAAEAGTSVEALFGRAA